MHEFGVRSVLSPSLPLSASHRISLILKRRHGSGNEEHGHKLPNSKVVHARRECVCCCFGFFLQFYFFVSLESTFVRLAHAFRQRWMGLRRNMSSERRQRRRHWNEEIKSRGGNTQTQADIESEGEKLWIAKRMICSQIGEKIKWYSAVES